MLGQQNFTALAVGFDEFGPPLAQFGIGLAGGATQQQKVVGGAKTQVFEHTIGRTAGAALEPWLQAPDFAHVGRETALNGQFFGLLVEHSVHGSTQSRDGVFAARQGFLPEFEDFMPEQAGKQKARRGGFPGMDAVVGVLQRQSDEPFTHRLFEHDVEHRQQTVMQAFGAQLPQAFQRVAGEQQLHHFVEQARRRHIAHQFGQAGDRLACAGVDGKTELGGKTHRAQHAHRVFAVTPFRVADHAHGLGADVGDALVVIDHDLRGRVIKQRVDGEVAPRGIIFLRAEDIVAQHTAVGIGFGVLRLVGTKG